MKRLLFLGVNILTVYLLFGLAGISLAVNLNPMGDYPLPVSPATKDIPLTDVTLTWRAPWYPSSDADYVPNADYEVWYQWRIGTTAGSSNIESSGDAPVNGMVKHPVTSVKLSKSLDPNKTYYWSVKAKRYQITDQLLGTRVLQSETAWSPANYGQFTTKTSLTFRITNPPYDNYKEFSPNTALEWTLVEGAQIYGWELQNIDKGTKKSGLTDKLKLSLGADSTWNFGYNYTFQVKAGNSCQKTGSQITNINNCVVIAEALTHFKTQAPSTIKAPELTAPSNGAKVSLPFNLTWKLAAGAETYKYQVWRKSPREVAIGPLSTNELTASISSGLENGVTYRWSAKSCWQNKTTKLEDCSDFAAEREFTVAGTATPPVTSFVPQLVSPSDGQKDISTTPTFTWKAVTGAVMYQIEVLGFPSVIPTLYTSINSSKYSDYWSEFNSGATYQWHVRASKDGGISWGDWSQVRTFATKGTVPAGAPAVPTNLSPCNKTGVSSTPTLNWKDVKAKLYYLYVGGFPRITIFHTSSIDIGSGDIGYYLQPGQTYLWWVEACNDAGCSSLSNFCEITIKAGGTTDGGTTGGGSGGGSGGVGGDCPAGQICNPLKYGNFEDLVNAIVNFLIKLSIPAATVMFVIAGFMFVISAGDPEKVRTAKRMMIYTAVGFAVILVASGLIKVLQSLLGG